METTTIDHMTATLGGIEGNGSEELSSVMEEVETYMTYKVASYINDYWFPILVPIGLIGNTLSFLVMMKANNRKISTCIYMAAISINDNLMMCVALHGWLVGVLKMHEIELWECKISVHIAIFTIQSSTYQVLAMTIDKYVAVKWPHRAASYSTPKRAKIILLSIFLCALIYNLPHLLFASLVGHQCLGYVVGGVFAEVFSWTSFLVNGFIPVSLLIYMNYVIVQSVINSRKMFRSNANPIITESVLETKRQKAIKSAENQLTIMLLLVTTLFLILLLPIYIRFIYFSLVERDTPSKYANSMFFFQITQKLSTTNNGINFFLYCISGRKFRNDLKEILGFSLNQTELSLNSVNSANSENLRNP